MAENLFETTENPLETAKKMTLLENKVDTAQKELEHTKKQFQDAETARDRAENARKYCVEQVERHAAKDRAEIDWHNLKHTRKIKGLTTEIDMLKRRVKALEATNAKHQEHEKSFHRVAVNVLLQSPESATTSAAFSNTLSDHG
jgi:predicted  nucleic acid-binding Zn-ribbon protein